MLPIPVERISMTAASSSVEHEMLIDSEVSFSQIIGVRSQPEEVRGNKNLL
jgi:hypothetical protein